MKRLLLLLVLATACAPAGGPSSAPTPEPAPGAVKPDEPLPASAALAVPAFKSSPLLTWGPLPPRTPHVERERSYDLQHQAVRVRFDWSRHAVVGSTTLDVAALGQPLPAVALDAVGMTIRSVQGAGGRSLRHDYDGKTLTVRLPTPLKPGATTRFTVAYEAVEPKKGAYFIDRNHYLWTQGETEDTRYWVPTYDYPNDKTTWEFRITTEKGEKALSNGRLAGARETADGTEWHWVQEKPASTYLMTAATGKYTIVRESWNDVPVDYWTYPDSVEAARRGFGATPQAVAIFSRKTGVPYPWAKYDQVVAPDYIFGGMENVTATTQLDDGILHPAWAEPQANADGLMAHELGHQWYGDLLTTESWAHVWLNEGFATFTEQIFREEAKGADEGAFDRLGAREQVIAADRNARRPLVYDRWVTNPLELFFSGHIYPKGATVLQMLRHRLGDGAFWAAMKLYTTEHAYQPVKTEDLQRAFEQSTGEDLTRFFEQWVYGAGMPVFRVRAEYDAGAGAVKLTADQVQPRDSLTGLFDADVEVEILTDRGPARQTVQVRGEHTTASIPVPAEPRSIRWNKGGWLLEVTDFPRSTAMLAYQLQHDDDVIGRAEAVDLLAERTEQPAAVAALARTAQSDTFWGVRARASDALTGFAPSDAAAEALVAASRDPDARVRQSAAASLGKFSGDAVVARLAELARGDASLYVRGAAVDSYARVAPEPALAAIREMLTEDSWLDLSRTAGVTALRRIDAPEAYDILLRSLADNTARATRQAAIQSLVAKAQGREAELATRLEPLLRANDIYVRQTTATALGRLGQESSVPALEARREGEPESRVVNAIDAALAAIRGR